MKRVLSMLFIVLFFGVFPGCSFFGFGDLVGVQSPNDNLMRAAFSGDVNGVADALRAGADVNARNKVGNTALMLAALRGQANVIPLLLRAGADVNAKANNGATALMFAALRGQENVIPLLLKAGADVNAKVNNGVTSLMAAAHNGQANVIPLLLKAGADVDAVAMNGATAESLAGGNFKSEIISLLDDWKASHSGTAVVQNSPSGTGTVPSGLSQSEAQDIAATQAAEQANARNAQELAAINRKLAALSAKSAPPKAPAFYSSVDRPTYSEPRHRKDFALVIGVEKYPNPIHAASFADRDARAMFAHLRALGVPLRHIKRLTDETATGNRIKGALHWLKRNVQPGATVYVYFSGHGAPGRSGDAYLVPFDGDPNDLSDTGVSTSAFYRDLEHLPVRHIIVALDACFTGEGKRSVLGKGIRPLVTKIKEGAVPSSGKLVVLTAARSDQESGILDSQGHGLFTYYLLKGLNGGAEHGGHVTVAGLYRYLKPKVQSEASLDNRDQTPELEPGTSGHSLSILLR